MGNQVHPTVRNSLRSSQQLHRDHTRTRTDEGKLTEWLFEHHLCKETKMVFHYVTVNFYTKLNLQGVAYNFGQ